MNETWIIMREKNFLFMSLWQPHVFKMAEWQAAGSKVQNLLQLLIYYSRTCIDIIKAYIITVTVIGIRRTVQRRVAGPRLCGVVLICA